MSVEWVARWSTGRALIRWLSLPTVNGLVARILPHLASGDTLIDIGAGHCMVAARLMRRGFAVTPVDVRLWSCEPGVVPQLADGASLPFPNDAFDVALLINVLHHTREPERVVAEAARVARRVIIFEDIYRNRAHLVATMAMDSIVNLEFLGHPHSNRNDAEWRATFRRLGLRLVDTARTPFWLVFQSGTYVVERSAEAPTPAPSR